MIINGILKEDIQLEMSSFLFFKKVLIFGASSGIIKYKCTLSLILEPHLELLVVSTLSWLNSN